MTLRSGFSDRYVVCSTTEIAFPFVCLSTQLNSTDLLRADWTYAATGSVALSIAGDS